MGNETAWVRIPSWPKYEASQTGLIRNASTRRVLKLRAHETNYHLYFYAARGRKCYVHRAVLEAFVGPCPAGQQTRHLDGDPANNNVANLCWGTAKENADDKRRHGTNPRGESSTAHKLTLRDVESIRNLYGSESLRRLADRFGVSHTAIRRAALGITWANEGGRDGR